jgi:hypothetical protein
MNKININKLRLMHLIAVNFTRCYTLYERFKRNNL